MSTAKDKAAHNAYMRAWNARNRAHVREQDRLRYAALTPEQKDIRRRSTAQQYQEKKEIRTERFRGYYKDHSDDIKARTRRWNQAHPEALTERTARRRALLRKAMPRWVDKGALRAVYAEAKSRTRATGVEHHVDHVFPLQHERFNGLHVPWNLQVLTAAQNLSKGNQLWV